ncbi:diguanylate phosphodiesterase [Desulfocarbo indianensis]|nr:diguanylate phosphodiesterase [Desulfocarbo indianensis]
MAAKKKDYFASLYKVAKLINSSLEPEEVLDGIVRGVAEGMGVKACALRLLDAKHDELRMGAYWGLSKGYLRKGKVTLSGSRLDKRALSGEAVYLEDVRSDPNFQYGERAKTEGIVSALVVPLQVNGRAIGVLRVYTARKRDFGKEDIAFLEASANLSAIALDKARLHKALKTDYDLLVADRDRIDDN